MKLFFRNIHLWLGLVSGLFIVFVCLTGTILVFEDEIEQTWHSERYFVTPAATPRLSLAQLTEAVRAYKPKAKIGGLKIYTDPARSIEVSLAGTPGGKGSEHPGGEGRMGEKPGYRGGEGDANGAEQGEGRGAAAGKGGPGNGGKGKGGGSRVFMNPYTGAVLGEMNPQDSFFKTVERLHRGLVAGEIGKLVMGINATVFLFILGTGLVLWWPATRKSLTARLKVKWGSGWKRLNHDFHIVLGFYAAIFLFIMAATGMGMAFDWVGQGIGKLTHSSTKRPEPPTSAVPTVAGAAPFAADAVLALARQQVPDAEFYTLQLPKEPTGSIQVSTLRPGAITERATDDVFLDQYSGQVIKSQSYVQKPAGLRIKSLFKPVHTGEIGGLPTKTLAFVISLLGATFPITGTIMWLNRTRKSRKKQPKLQAA